MISVGCCCQPRSGRSLSLCCKLPSLLQTCCWVGVWVGLEGFGVWVGLRWVGCGVGGWVCGLGWRVSGGGSGCVGWVGVLQALPTGTLLVVPQCCNRGNKPSDCCPGYLVSHLVRLPPFLTTYVYNRDIGLSAVHARVRWAGVPVVLRSPNLHNLDDILWGG